jgi:hypothetical protein
LIPFTIPLLSAKRAPCTIYLPRLFLPPFFVLAQPGSISSNGNPTRGGDRKHKKHRDLWVPDPSGAYPRLFHLRRWALGGQNCFRANEEVEPL